MLKHAIHNQRKIDERNEHDIEFSNREKSLRIA